MSEPSRKSNEVEQLLKEFSGFDRRDTIKANVCVPAPIGCGGPASEFRDEISRKEFTISGLCQKCQDSIFI